MDQSVDKSNLRQVMIDFPKQFNRALDFTKGLEINGDFDKLFVCGMGGSALPVDIVKSYLSSKGEDFPVHVVRDYSLPKYANEKSLVVASSYSGNTEETISCYKHAQELGAKVVGLSKAGKVEELCSADGNLHVKYPDDGPTFQPRYAIGYSVISILRLLEKAGKIGAISEDFEALAKFLESLDVEAKGKGIASHLVNKIPIVYTTDKYGETMARIIKIKINETSKMQSFWNVFPEMNHNEMVGYTNLKGEYHMLIFRDPDEHERNLKRFDITSKLLEEKEIPVTTIDLEGGDQLQKTFYGLAYGDWISYYLALEYGQDPTPVDMVEDLKKALG